MYLADLRREQVPSQRCPWVLVLRPAGAACPQPAPLHSNKMMPYCRSLSVTQSTVKTGSEGLAQIVRVRSGCAQPQQFESVCTHQSKNQSHT